MQNIVYDSNFITNRVTKSGGYLLSANAINIHL